MIARLVLAGLLLAVPVAAQDTPVMVTGPTTAAEALAPATPPALSELDRLRVENHLLRLRVVQLEAQAQTQALSQERDRLDAALAETHPGWRMDWQTGALVPATQDK